jgi:hypothetical protein
MPSRAWHIDDLRLATRTTDLPSRSIWVASCPSWIARRVVDEIVDQVFLPLVA